MIVFILFYFFFTLHQETSPGRVRADPGRWSHRHRSQFGEELCENPVPGVGVVQVTGMTGALHHHYAVIGQIAQVTARLLPQLSVLVAVDDERRDLEDEETQNHQTKVKFI